MDEQPRGLTEAQTRIAREFSELPKSQRFLAHQRAERETGTPWYQLTPDQRTEFRQQAISKWIEEGQG